jgi:hypothetical protein
MIHEMPVTGEQAVKAAEFLDANVPEQSLPMTPFYGYYTLDSRTRQNAGMMSVMATAAS